MRSLKTQQHFAIGQFADRIQVRPEPTSVGEGKNQPVESRPEQVYAPATYDLTTL
jgi:hypothetical protein